MAGVASMEAATAKLEQASELLAESKYHMEEAPAPTYLPHDNAVDNYRRNLQAAYAHCDAALKEAKLGCVQATLALEELERHRR